VVRNVARMVADQHDTDIVFSGRLRLKDASYGVQLADGLGVDARFGHVATQIYDELVEMGAGEANESKVMDALRGSRPSRLSGK
jgi:3-hydroxyisobutyrate dehydrogenase